MSETLIVVLLSLLLGIQAITTDLYLPAVPLLASDLGATAAQAQLTLTGLLLAFGLSQLVWGPLSDRFGRRPVILLSKHQSAWETIFYCWAMPRPMIFVFKKSLLYIPFFGWGLAMLRMIAYGSELNLAHPPRPTDPKIAWEPDWNVKLRVKSMTTTMMVGTRSEFAFMP